MDEQDTEFEALKVQNSERSSWKCDEGEAVGSLVDSRSEFELLKNGDNFEEFLQVKDDEGKVQCQKVTNAADLQQTYEPVNVNTATTGDVNDIEKGTASRKGSSKRGRRSTPSQAKDVDQKENKLNAERYICAESEARQNAMNLQTEAAPVNMASPPCDVDTELCFDQQTTLTGGSGESCGACSARRAGNTPRQAW